MRLGYVLPLALVTAFSSGIACAAEHEEGEGATHERRELRKEEKEHPRMGAAIKELDEAIAELKKAPHDFGGHREDAVKACENARDQLKKALEYREDKSK